MAEVSDGALSSMVCKKLWRLLKEGMFLASVPTSVSEGTGIRTVVGLVPDGVTGVRIHASNARPRTVPVVENVFALRDRGRAFPESIELIRGG
jgi:hypothetical protein